MFSLACAWGLGCQTAPTPAGGVRKYKEKKRERFLTRDEYRRLGQALLEAEMDADAGIEGRGLALRPSRRCASSC